MEKDKELALKLGLCWYEYDVAENLFCIHCGRLAVDNPDFTTPDGIILLLREMMKREDWPRFLDSTGGFHNCFDHGQGIVWEDSISINYILKPGKLRDAALAFLPPEGKEKV